MVCSGAMPRRFLLLTGNFEASLLLPHLERLTEPDRLLHAISGEDLDRRLAEDPTGTRVIAFCTATIVPRRHLDRLGAPAYNIHPGPPNYPGRHPESWGAYRDAGRFGATLHEMAPRVDEGAIVDVEWVELPPGSGQSDYGMSAFRAAITLFMRWAPRLFSDEVSLPRHPTYRWSGAKTTHADFVAMCRVDPSIDKEEFLRRQRAFAQQPGSEMTVNLHGTEFRWVAPLPEREGKPAA